jgi:hypothetical protein
MDMDSNSQNMVDLSGGGVGRSYRPSGRVNVLLFAPLFLFAMSIAILMALLLYTISDSWYLFFITPLLLCLPVLGVIYITIRGGRCRSGILASITGMALMLAYYGGYWSLNYLSFLSYYEEQAQPILEYETGSKGFLGFIQFYCKNSTIESYPNPISKDKQPNKVDQVFSYIFYSGEFIILLVLGMRMSYVLSQSVFIESIKKWARAKKVRFMVSDLAQLQRIVEQKDWAGLQKLPKLPKFGQQTAFLEFITEFSTKADMALPFYVSVKSNNSAGQSTPQSKTKIAKSIFSKYIIKQMAMEAGQLQAIAEVMPEWKLPCSRQAAGFTAAAQQNRSGQGSTPTADFRDQAVAASLAQVGHWTSTNISDIDASICLSIPAEHRVSVKKMAITKIGILVIGLICIFGGIGIAALGANYTIPDSKDLAPLGIILVSIGASFFVLAILIVFSHILIFTTMLKRYLLGRAGCLFDSSCPPKLRKVSLEDAKTYHIGKLAGEDICLYHLDKQKQRLVMEGCNHRYIIRGRDITRLESLKTGPEAAIGVFYKIGDTELAIVLQVESIKWYALNPLLSINSANRFIKRLKTDLGVQD